MSRQRPNQRLNLANAGTSAASLAAFASDPAVQGVEPAAAAPTPPAPSHVVDDDDIANDTYDYGDDDHDVEPVEAPAPATSKGRAKPAKRSAHIQMKTYPMLRSTVQTVSKASIDWHISDPSRLEKFGGTASETAFVQALLLFAVDRISKNEKEAQRLLRYFPENARIRNK
ncbi:hypothetical protein [Prescottella subtropica]|uniref:hypothetical protein n=1 Tax=Prescottella subtropica TaxID=2545757 RepID=UPI0010F55E47|nr:hypothetical protein [Prescottella subtropica]